MIAASALLATVALATSPLGERHQLSGYLQSTGVAFISNTRTAGGIGGGVGVVDLIDRRWLLQADVNALTGLGNALSVRLGAGIQRDGLWAPAALVQVTGLFGGNLGFPVVEAPGASSGMTLMFSLAIAPARFRVGPAQVSFFELSAGVGPDAQGPGFCVGLTLFQAAVAF